MTRLFLANALVLLLSACGGDGGSSGGPSARALVGTYEVTSHTYNGTACDGEGAPQEGFSHFELREGSPFFGLESLELFECTGAATCEADFSQNFFSDGSGWTLEASYSSGFDMDCSIGKSQSLLTSTAMGVRIRSEERSGNVVPPAGIDCLDIEVDDYVADLACSLEVIEGTRL